MVISYLEEMESEDRGRYGENDRDHRELDDLVKWVQETSRPETERELAVPKGLRDRPSFAPNIPVLGVALEETDGGLLIPKQPIRYPADMWGRYVTGSEITGYEMSLNDLRSDLKKYPLFPLVVGLSNLTCAMEMGSPVSREMKDDFLTYCTPDVWRERLRTIFRAEDVGVSSPQVSLAALKLVFQEANDQEGDVPFDLIAPIVYVMADHMSEDRAGRADEFELFGLELARYALFYAQSDPVLVFARHHRMWIDIAPELTNSRDFVDLDDVFKKAAGVGLSDFAATTFWMHPLFAVRGRRLFEARNLEVERVRLTSRLRDEIIDSVLDAIAADAEWFRENVSDERTPSSWFASCHCTRGPNTRR